MELLTFFDEKDVYVYNLNFEDQTPFIAAASFEINEEAIRGIKRVIGSIYPNLKYTSYLLLKKLDKDLNVIGYRLIAVLDCTELNSTEPAIEEMKKNLDLMGVPLENRVDDVRDFTNEIFTHVGISRSYNSHMQMLANIKRGKEFGYPDCCILEFIEGMIKTHSGIPKVLPKDFKLKGTGFVPCTSCNKTKSEDELVNEINLKRNTLKHGYFRKDMR